MNDIQNERQIRKYQKNIVDSLFGSSFRTPFKDYGWACSCKDTDKDPDVNIVEDGNQATIRINVAGYNRDELSVEEDSNRNILTVSGEKSNEDEFSFHQHNSFKKSFTLNEEYVKSSATLKDGILTIVLAQKTNKVKEIEIKE